MCDLWQYPCHLACCFPSHHTAAILAAVQVLLLLLACAAFRTALSTALSAAEPVRVEYYMEALCP